MNSLWFLIWERPPLTGSMKEVISGIMMEEVGFLQTSTLQVFDILIDFYSDAFVAGIQKALGRLEFRAALTNLSIISFSCSSISVNAVAIPNIDVC